MLGTKRTTRFPKSAGGGGGAISAENLPSQPTRLVVLLLSLLFLLSGWNLAFAENETETPRKISEPTTTFATFLNQQLFLYTLLGLNGTWKLDDPPPPIPTCIFETAPNEPCVEGDAIHLGSGTRLVDGAGVPCESTASILLAATGQTTFGTPFPALDVMHGGYLQVSSPAHGGVLGGGLFGLERIQVVINVPGTGSPYLREGLWRGTPAEYYWDDSRQGNNQLPQVCEITVYDANGTGMRFIGTRETTNDPWTYRAALGVQAVLEEDYLDFYTWQFRVIGGPPGAMQSAGTWIYEFDAPAQNDNKCRLVRIQDPLGNLTLLGIENGERILTDLTSGSQLKFDIETGEIAYRPPALSPSGNWTAFGQVSSEETLTGFSGNFLFGSGSERVKLSWNDWASATLHGGANDTPQYTESWEWQAVDALEREENLYQKTYGWVPDRGRLTRHQIGGLSPTTYFYAYGTGRHLETTITRGDGQELVLDYGWDEYGKISQLDYRRPRLDNPSNKEKLLYWFGSHGQLTDVRFCETENTPWTNATWSQHYAYEEPGNPLLLTGYTDKYGQTWTLDYNGVSYGGSTDWLLTQVSDPEEVSVQVVYGDTHNDLPYTSHDNPSNLPTHIQLGSQSEKWRLDYTWTGTRSVGSNDPANGLLRAFSEPGRGWWQLEYNEPGSDHQNKLKRIVDPTDREVVINAYDTYGRPTEVGAPLDDDVLWRAASYTLWGQPETMAWGKGATTAGTMNFVYEGLFLTQVEDPRHRTVNFLYNTNQAQGLTGFLGRIEFGNEQVFASLNYDDYGRLASVVGGNYVGVSYEYYPKRDELKKISYTGENAYEEFNYLCCGKLDRWKKQDNRTVYFTYHEPGDRLHKIHLGNENNPIAEYDYDAAGRLGKAQDLFSLNVFRYDTGNGSYGYPSGHAQNQLSTGRLLRVSTTLASPVSEAFVLDYEYHPSGDVERVRFKQVQGENLAELSNLQYTYDGAGRLTGLTYNNGQHMLASWSYDDAGRLAIQTVQPLNTSNTLGTEISYADTQSPGGVGTMTHRWNGTTTFATFDYDGTTNELGYYPDGTLRFAQESVFSQSRQWRWDYHYDGSLASEQLNSQSPVEFTYDSGGNLTSWGSESGWQYSGNFLTGISSRNWSFQYTANGERSIWYAGPRQGNHLIGDVDQNGCVGEEDLLAVLFAYGQGPNYTGPEDVDGDGDVDDDDLLIVMFHLGTYAWFYDYDVWGNLIRASSPCVDTYEAGYDSLGRRVWQEIDDVRTYFLYDGDTLIAEVAEVNNEWQLIAEYLWGPLGPLMMRRYNPQTQSWYNYYYVQDGLGHTRLLLDGNGNVVNRYAYDAWGNLIEYVENVPNPFTWNGAYGYEWIAITGLYHIGAREYDPRTARWLQRDPIEASSGDPNFWRYCGNDPVNGVDPSGLDLLDNAANFFAGWGDRLTALPDWLGGDSLTQHVRRFLGVDEVVDPCSEAYLRGDLVGTVHDFLLTRGRGGGVRQGLAQGGKKAGRRAEQELSSRAARREAMRQGGVPTSQQPSRQGGQGDYRWYEYEVPKPGGGKQPVIVQHHPADRQHPSPHWEAGPKKPGPQPDTRVRGPRYGGGRGKLRVPYRR